MTFNIISTFRNNESYLSNFLIPMLLVLEKKYDFYYYFYENDSEDNTKKIIEKFMEGRQGKFKHETLGNKHFKRGIEFLHRRVSSITKCRNKLLNLRPFKGEWSIILDSDIYFKENIIDQFIKLKKPDKLVALGCNGKSDTKCLIHARCNAYYDTLALIDKKGDYFHKESDFKKSQCCPFTNKNDKKQWSNGELVEVDSAFGGVCFYKTNIINNPTLKYENITSVRFNKNFLYCEHWDFNKKLKQFGELYVTPKIIVNNYENIT